MIKDHLLPIMTHIENRLLQRETERDRHTDIQTETERQTVYLFYVLFNDALNTFFINGYIGVGNILIGKIPSVYLAGIDLISTACQTGAYTTRVSRRP